MNLIIISPVVFITTFLYAHSSGDINGKWKEAISSFLSKLVYIEKIKVYTNKEDSNSSVSTVQFKGQGIKRKKQLSWTGSSRKTQGYEDLRKHG